MTAPLNREREGMENAEDAGGVQGPSSGHQQAGHVLCRQGLERRTCAVGTAWPPWHRNKCCLGKAGQHASVGVLSLKRKVKMSASVCFT